MRHNLYVRITAGFGLGIAAGLGSWLAVAPTAAASARARQASQSQSQQVIDKRQAEDRAHMLRKGLSQLPIGSVSGWITPPTRPLVLVNQVGYRVEGPKDAVVEAEPGDDFQKFKVLDWQTGETVAAGTLHAAGKVPSWHNWIYWTADFSKLRTPGRYTFVAEGRSGTIRSYPFRVAKHALKRYTLSNLLYYLEGQKDNGVYAAADMRLPSPSGKGTLDVHGGWYDATGDQGIHMAQFGDSDFTNESAAMVAWSLPMAFRNLRAVHNPNYTQYLRRLLNQSIYGADWLVRLHLASQGTSFIATIGGPGVLKLAKDRRVGVANAPAHFGLDKAPSGGKVGVSVHRKAEPVWPQSYIASFRGGGGLSIGALALDSMLPQHGTFSNQEYLQTAQDAYRYLRSHNAELLKLGDGHRDVLGVACKLVAAADLYQASGESEYLADATAYANKLMGYLRSHGPYQGYWAMTSNSNEPFYSATDAGLPVVALTQYVKIAKGTESAAVISAIRKSLSFDLAITGREHNPFGYARMLVETPRIPLQPKFFFPHDSPVGPWWQGDDARLASLAAAARGAVHLFSSDPSFQRKLEAYSTSQLNWILGLNPYDVSMMIGSGHENAQYFFFNSWQYTSAPGAIINGITSSPDTKRDDGIAFDLTNEEAGGHDNTWRWVEQWLPHAGWYLYAVSLHAE